MQIELSPQSNLYTQSDVCDFLENRKMISVLLELFLGGIEFTCLM